MPGNSTKIDDDKKEAALSTPDSDKTFSGSIPMVYEEYLVPMIFEPYAVD